jgi:hypothetical protein
MTPTEAPVFNGQQQQQDPLPVPFGPGRDQAIPHSWAGIMLTELHRTNPALFGKLVSKAIGAVRR